MVPYVQQNYKLKPELTLVGHSFGAYFATYCFLKNNKLFNSCVAISPAYWPNQKDIYKLAERVLSNQTITGNFFLANGDKRWDEISLQEGVAEFRNLMDRRKGIIRFEYAELGGFNHNSTPTVGFGLGLNFVFDEWKWESEKTDG